MSDWLANPSSPPLANEKFAVPQWTCPRASLPLFRW